MSTVRPSLRRMVMVAVAVVVLGVATRAAAGTTTTGPSVSVDKARVRPGEHVVLTIDGFQASSVTISICGNEARRGSSDCNMTESEGLHLDGDGTSTVAQIPVAEPPVGCPCLIRVSTRSNDEIATAPITIIGHQVEPVVDGLSLEDPLDVSITARPDPDGVVDGLRSELGGPTRYEVTVTVRNHSPITLRAVRISGAATRSGDNNLARLEFDDPGPIESGQTWRQVVSAVVPAPSFGRVEWTVAVSGGGPTVTATHGTRHRPILLIVVLMLLVVDIFLLGMRWVIRRRIASAAARAAAAGGAIDTTAVDEDAVAEEEDRQLVPTS